MGRVGLLRMLCVLVWASLAAMPTHADDLGTRYDRSHFDAPKYGQASAILFGQALPPLGYVDFCGRGEAECQYNGGAEKPLHITTATWDQIVQVNRHVNDAIKPVTDMENYGKINFWTYPIDSGLCHSFALLKKRYLTELGINPDKLLMTVVLTETGEGHAVLTIPTDKGDYILDNRRQEILRWDETGYIFLKRQSQPQSNQWVSLQKTTAPVAVATRSRSFASDFFKMGKRRGLPLSN